MNYCKFFVGEGFLQEVIFTAKKIPWQKYFSNS